MVERLADTVDHLAALGFFDVEIGGQRNIHVQQGSLDERVRRLAAVSERIRDASADHRWKSGFEHPGIAADIPGRRQSDRGVNRSDTMGCFIIVLAHGAGEQIHPVVELFFARFAHHRIGPEHLRKHRLGADEIVEIGKGRGAVLLDRLAYSWKRAESRLRKIERCQAIFEGEFGRTGGVFCVHDQKFYDGLVKKAFALGT